MSDKLKKADKDYSEELDAELPQIEKLSLAQPDEALGQLLAFEKKVRQASDLISSKRVLVAIAKLLTASGQKNWDELNEQVQILVKKHGQSKQAITSLVEEVILQLDHAPNLTTKLATIETLRTITDGRIYLELERARVTRILAGIEVAEYQNYTRAADLMGELQVETFSSMEMPEKIDFILEQITLYAKKGDYVQAAIASRKILPRCFKDAKTNKRVAEQKVRYYQLKVDVALHDNEYLDVCVNLRHIYDTPAFDISEAAAEQRRHETLGNLVLFAVLAPHDNAQSDMLQRLAVEPDLSLLPLFQQLVTMFTTSELIRWPKMVDVYGTELAAHWVFTNHTLAESAGHRRWEDLHHRVIEHNIRVIARFYARISFTGLAELLDLQSEKTEDVLAKLVVSGMVWARIDRPKRVVSFTEPQDADDVLNGWSNNTAKLLEHVETICHLISKEEMLHGVKAA